MKQHESQPEGLRPPTAAWWRQVVDEYELEPHHLRLLALACRAWDDAERAREIIAAEGMISIDRFGQRRAHPAVEIERRARDQFRVMVRELGLDVAPPAEAPRGPARPANAMLRRVS